MISFHIKYQREILKIELDNLLFLNWIESFREILPCPAAFFLDNGQLLGCTDPSKSPQAILIIRQCLQTPQYSKEIAASYNAEYAVLQNESEEPLCSVLFLDALGRSDLIAPVRTLLLLNLHLHELQNELMPDSGDRLSFVYQLLSSRSAQNDILRARALQLHYIIQKPRVTIIFQVAPSTDSDNVVLTDFSTGEGQQIFFKALASTPGHCEDDIGDFMNMNLFSLLKAIPEEEKENPKKYLTRFIEPVLETMSKVSGLQLRVCVGSCYDYLLDLRSSYEEAGFLARNFDFFASSEQQILFITDYIYDYLASLTPEAYYTKKFSYLKSLLDNQPVLSRTLTALSQNDMNLRACASTLDIHRNTMQQRYEKIKTKLEIDPAGNSQDRMTLRQYTLFSRKKTVIHAGVIIQCSNVLNLLYRKLAEQVYHNSDGEMELDVHTLGLSANNELLFDLLRHGEMDIAVGNPDSLIPFVGEQISAINAPFLFDSSDQALSLLNSHIGRELLSPLKDNGFISLAFWSMGWRYFSCPDNFSIKIPQDFFGHRIRIMKKPLIASWLRYLGAIPCMISYDKILSALEEGLVEMQENPYWNFYEMHFYRQQKHILEINMMFDSDILLTTPAAWNKLTARQQEILRHSINVTTQWHREYFLPNTTSRRQKILDKGVQIHHPTQEEELSWRKAAKDFLSQSQYYETIQKIERAKYRYQEET